MTNAGSKEVMAKNLTYYIERSGKTQKEIADAIDVPPSTFSAWVKAKKYPRIEKIETLASYFGVSKSDLIEDKVEHGNKVDVAVDIVIRLGKDKEFCEVVKMLNTLDSKQLSSVKNMLCSFLGNE